MCHRDISPQVCLHRISLPIASYTVFNIDPIVRRQPRASFTCHEKTRLQKPTRTAPLSRSTPLPNPPTNGSHIHSHTFRSRILHTGTLYPPLPPTLASVNTYSPPPHLHFRLLASRTCQPSASKVRASLRRVCPGNFQDIAQHHSQ